MDKLVIPEGSVLVGETVLISHQGDVVIEGDVQPRSIRSVHGSITFSGNGKHCETLTAENGSADVSGATFSCDQIVAGEANLQVDDLKVNQSLAVGNQLKIRSKSADIPACIGGDMDIHSGQLSAGKIEAKGSVKLVVDGAKIQRLEADRLVVKGSLECKKLIAREMVKVESGSVAIKYLDTPSFQAGPEVTGVVMVATTKDVRAEGVRGFLHPSELGFLSQDEGEGEAFSTGTFEIATQDLPSFDDGPTTLDEADLDEVDTDDVSQEDSPLEEAELVEAEPVESESHDDNLDDTNPDSAGEPLVPDSSEEYHTKLVETDVEDWATRLTDDSHEEVEELEPEAETAQEDDPETASDEGSQEDSSVFIEELTPEDLDSASLEELSDDLDEAEQDEKDGEGSAQEDEIDPEPFREEIDSLTASGNESMEPQEPDEPEPNRLQWDAETVGVAKESLADLPTLEEASGEAEASDSIEDTHPSEEWVPDDSPNATEFEIVGRDPLDMSVPAIVPMDDSADQLEGEIEVSSEDFANVEELEEVSATDLEPEISAGDSNGDEAVNIPSSSAENGADENPSGDEDDVESSLSLDDLGDPLEEIESADLEADPLGSDELLEVVDSEPETDQETAEEYLDVDSDDLEELPDPLEDSALEIPDPQEDFDVLDEADILEEEDPEEVVISDLTDILNRIQAYFPEDNYPQFINQIHRYLEERRLNLFVKPSNRRAVLSSFDKFGHDEIGRLARSFFERLDLFFEEQNA